MRLSLRLCLAVGLVAGANAARADDEKIAVKDLPKAVADAVKARFPRAEVTAAEKSTEDGKTAYEVSLKDGKNEMDASFTPEGKLLAIETEVPVKNLPPPVTDAIKAKYPKGTMKSAAWVLDYGSGKEKKFYEVIVATGAKKNRELDVNLAGQILSDEEEEDD